MYGLKPDTSETVIAAWGARAILMDNGGKQAVDIIPDRQQITPETVSPAFAKWLNTTLSNWLNPKPRQRTPKIGYVDRAGSEVFSIDDGVFHAKACANRSYGYLYIGAWMTTNVGVQKHKGKPQ